MKRWLRTGIGSDIYTHDGHEVGSVVYVEDPAGAYYQARLRNGQYAGRFTASQRAVAQGAVERAYRDTLSA